MSEPKRYHHFIKFYNKSFTDVTGARYCYPDAGMIEDKDGKYVEYDDYASLKAEVERLTAFTTRTIIPNEELQAQVERLTKAGDALADKVNYHYVEMGAWGNHPIVQAWKAAKEGKQS